jgi:hypothetical protein
MNRFKYILIITVSFCIAAQGAGFSRVCLASNHSGENLSWAGTCHTRPASPGTINAADTYALDHEDHDCIDISIFSVAGFRQTPRLDTRPHPFGTVVIYPGPFSQNRSANLLLIQLADRFSHFSLDHHRSIRSTILIV